MTGEPMPAFRYHPDPVATGAVVPRAGFECPVCGLPREHAYIGPYSTPDFHFENGDEVCAWCIADGSAAREWRASFVEPAYLSEAAQAAMSAEALTELEHRTPSYLCLQQERWLDHHGEADAFHGSIGVDEYLGLPPAAQAAVRNAAGDDPLQPLRDDDAVLRLRPDGDGPTGYLFQCLHCGRYDAFVATG
jgi:uncharacterized protein CbrC (UPF0167 family)